MKIMDITVKSIKIALQEKNMSLILRNVIYYCIQFYNGEGPPNNPFLIVVKVHFRLK